MTRDCTNERTARTSIAIKVSIVNTVLGLTNAIVGICLMNYLNLHPPPTLEAVRRWDAIVLWLCPGGIIMMAEPKGPFSEAFALVYSVLLTGWLYCLGGLLVGGIWQKLRSVLRES